MHFIKTNETKHFFEITLNRPEKRNAFHPQMIEELTQAFRVASASNARAVVLTGEGKSFCAGADLEWMQSMVNYSFAENIADSEKLFEMFLTAVECDLPIITYAHGHVMGGALGLLAVSDIVALEENTKLSFSEVKLGLAPAVISPFVMRKMKMSYAHKLMLTGERFSSETAYNSGLVTEVVDESSASSAIMNLKSEFLLNGPDSVTATKKLLTTEFVHYLTAQKDFVCEVISERRVSEEGQLGLKGFIEKQDIPWKVNTENA